MHEGITLIKMRLGLYFIRESFTVYRQRMYWAPTREQKIDAARKVGRQIATARKTPRTIAPSIFSGSPHPVFWHQPWGVRLQYIASIGPASLGQIPGKACLKPYRSQTHPEAKCVSVKVPWFSSDRNKECRLSCNASTSISACFYWYWERRLPPLFF